MSLLPTSRVCIADLEGRDTRVREGLLAAAVETGCFSELVTWAVSHDARDRAVLERLGFTPVASESAASGFPSVLVRLIRERGGEPWEIERRPLLDPATWDMRMLYSMAG